MHRKMFLRGKAKSIYETLPRNEGKSWMFGAVDNLLPKAMHVREVSRFTGTINGI